MSVTLQAESGERPVQLNTILLKPELSDVQFSVSKEGHRPKVFHAHKLVLAVASDVFKTMFYGSVPQENPVVIKDSTPEEFEAFLRFIYTGTTKIAGPQVFPFLYLARKYLVGSLVKALMGHLEEGITAENVGQVIRRGQNFLDDAPSKFWESVESHGEALLSSEEFLNLRKDTVIALLERNLEVEEKIVYAKAVAWANATCARKKFSCNGTTIRKELDGVIQLIRFPTMSADDFTRGPAAEDVLTAEEKVELFKWFTSRIPQKLFPDTPRYCGTDYVCERFESKYGGGYDEDEDNALDFRADCSVRVTGFGVYGQSGYGYGDDRQNYTITAKLLLDGAVLATKEVSGSVKQSEDIIPVNFDKHIKLDPSKYYTACVAVYGLIASYGDLGVSTKTVATTKGNVVFTFKESSIRSSRDCAREGQIPQILFRV